MRTVLSAVTDRFHDTVNGSSQSAAKIANVNAENVVSRLPLVQHLPDVNIEDHAGRLTCRPNAG